MKGFPIVLLALASSALGARQLLPPRQASLSASGSASIAPSVSWSGTAPAAAPSASSGSSSGPRCGKGFTYCGYMLTAMGHDFAPSAVNNTYCDDLPGACAGGRPRTAPDQAVYYCEDSGVARLLCACSGRCVNEAQTNHIAHCDRPCVNS